MEITLKLYAGLSQYLPDDAIKHASKVRINPDETPLTVIDRFNVPQDAVHLVLLNGIYLETREREQACFKDGDVLAVWPPVAGG